MSCEMGSNNVCVVSASGRLKPPVVQPLPVPLIHMFEETRSPEPWVFDAPI